jgi:hypothetical protein
MSRNTNISGNNRAVFTAAYVAILLAAFIYPVVILLNV